jgi:hypothetical protein
MCAVGMPPWDAALTRAFQERYLHSQHNYLGSVSDLIINAYQSKGSGDEFWQTRARAIAHHVDLSCRSDIVRLGPGSKEKSLSNLANAWYNECALFDPPADGARARMMWASWKIVQFYYTIFMAMSAIVRSFEPPVKALGQEPMTNIFTTRVLDTRRFRSDFVVFPFNVYLGSSGQLMRPSVQEVGWDYAEAVHIPNVERALRWASRRRLGRVTGLFHYFRDLREWAQYEDAHLMARLYGPQIIDELDRALRNIAFSWLMVSELWAACRFGTDPVVVAADKFSSTVRSVHKIEPTTLQARLAVLQALLR